MPVVKSELYPFEGQFVDHGGVRQHYVDEGPRDAPPVVMVHGNPTWSFYYRRLVQELRSDHRVIAIDHVGCGLSDKPSSEDYDYSLRRRVDDLESVLVQAGAAKRVTLVVHDWGGMIGMAWAARDPSRVARLVVLNTAAFRNPKGTKLPWQIAACRNPLVGGLITRGFNAFVKGASSTCTVKPLPDEVRAMYERPYDSWANRVAIHEFVKTIPLSPQDAGYDIVEWTEASLSDLSSRPTLICWGEQDFVFDAVFREEWERRFPDAEVHRFENAGHYVLEDAGEEIAPLVRDFLLRHPVGPE